MADAPFTLKIKLTQDKVAIVDPCDFALVRQYSWHAEEDRHTWYAYAWAGNGTKKIAMHRLILSLSEGEKADHADGNGLNNIRKNLRRCTEVQNSQNRRKTHGSSKFKGVSWREMQGIWGAAITARGRRINLGSFTREELAALAYDNAALKHFGKFARTNKMMGLL